VEGSKLRTEVMNTKEKGNANIQIVISHFSNLLSKNEMKKDKKTEKVYLCTL
jgi:hypothetical protein